MEQNSSSEANNYSSSQERRIGVEVSIKQCGIWNGMKSIASRCGRL